MRLVACLVSISMLAACSSVTVRTDDLREETRAPTFQQRYTYWWWGLKGEHSINVREICAGTSVSQIQAVSTLADTLAGVFTLGVYAPRTAKVWCKS